MATSLKGRVLIKHQEERRKLFCLEKSLHFFTVCITTMPVLTSSGCITFLPIFSFLTRSHTVTIELSQQDITVLILNN
ncbi:hypothetical protein INR49_026284 [Caranx melampygus]|nr:hypothetical protein INR49_026284 [Caranx melampygus]